MILEHPKLEPFEPLLTSVMDVALTGGLQQLQSDGFKFEDMKTNERARNRFMRGCHRGYDKAQVRIAAEVVRLQKQIDWLENVVKELRAKHDRDEVRSTVEVIRILQSRQLVLRRVVDGILWTILAQESWVIRHLMLDHHIHPIQPGVLERTVKVASARNAEDRARFYLVSDLTTVVQIGDLLEQNLRLRGARAWRVLELKDGRINERLLENLKREKMTISQETGQRIETEFGKTGLVQARRIVRQAQREDNLKLVLERDHGLVSGTRAEMWVTPDLTYTEDYLPALWSATDRAKASGTGVLVIDHCLALVAIRGEVFHKTGSSGIRHLFYHMRNPQVACGFETNTNPESRSTEIRGIESQPTSIDLVEQNLRGQWGTPLTIAPREYALDLIMGRIRIFVQFDLQRFCDLAAASGVKLAPIARRDIEKACAKLGLRMFPIICTPGVFGVKVEFPDAEMTQMSGFFGRIVLDFLRPMELVRFLRRGRDNLQKIRTAQKDQGR